MSALTGTTQHVLTLTLHLLFRPHPHWRFFRPVHSQWTPPGPTSTRRCRAAFPKVSPQITSGHWWDLHGEKFPVIFCFWPVQFPILLFLETTPNNMGRLPHPNGNKTKRILLTELTGRVCSRENRSRNITRAGTLVSFNLRATPVTF